VISSFKSQKTWIRLILGSRIPLNSARVHTNCTIEYHPRKANVVADALSCKNRVALSKPIVGKDRQLVELKRMGVKLGINAGGGLVAQLLVRPMYRE